MQLYDYALSGNCYKVRLFAALAKIEINLITVDLSLQQQKSQRFQLINPLAQVPVLLDRTLTLGDSQAILIYLASEYADHAWYPSSPDLQAEVNQWLFIAANEIQHGPNAARAIKRFHYQFDATLALANTARILNIIELHLTDRNWLALNRPTIADIAVFPYVALAPEGDIDLRPYPHIQAWIRRIKMLPNYISMPGTEI